MLRAWFKQTFKIKTYLTAYLQHNQLYLVSAVFIMEGSFVHKKGDKVFFVTVKFHIFQTDFFIL